jgi:hypothetical protein
MDSRLHQARQVTFQYSVSEKLLDSFDKLNGFNKTSLKYFISIILNKCKSYFFPDGDWTQGFELDRQELYHLGYTSSLLFLTFAVFEIGSC